MHRPPVRIQQGRVIPDRGGVLHALLPLCLRRPFSGFVCLFCLANPMCGLTTPAGADAPLSVLAVLKANSVVAAGVPVCL